MHVRSTVLLATVVLFPWTGCGGDDAVRTSSSEIPTPMLQSLTPARVTAGEEISVIGNNFCSPPEGKCKTQLVCDGTYQSAVGAQGVSGLIIEPHYQTPGKMSWKFGPNIPFATNQPTVGTFSGSCKAVNIGLTVAENAESPPKEVTVQVGPSIIIKQMGPLAAGCGADFAGTTSNTPFVVQVEAVGLNPGTSEAPVMFRYTFLKENFQLTGMFKEQYRTDPQELFPQQGPVSMIQRVENGTVGGLGTGNQTTTAVVSESGMQSGTNSGSALFDQMLGMLPNSVGGIQLGVDNLYKVDGIKTSPIPRENDSHYKANLVVTAADNAGHVASRSIIFDVWRQYEVSYDGNAQEVQYYEPEPVSGCMPGTTPPSELSYGTQYQRSATRSLTFVGRVKPDFALWGLKPFVLNKFETEFGINVDEAATSSEVQSRNLSVQLIPGQAGVIYLQRIELQRLAKIIEHDSCGKTSHAGDAIVTDWQWGSEIALGTHGCQPLPRPKTLKATGRLIE